VSVMLAARRVHTGPDEEVGKEPGAKTFTAVADGRLKTLQQLGRGSSATVTQCRWNSPNGGQQMVAMKKIRTELLQNPQEVKSFVSEVRLLRRLEHRWVGSHHACAAPKAPSPLTT
jgi:hypothetical protein